MSKQYILLIEKHIETIILCISGFIGVSLHDEIDDLIHKKAIMIKLIRIASFYVFSMVLLGCSSNKSDLIQKMEQIKNVGNDNPSLALSMLDSITILVRDESEYVQMKYDLLSLRLHDKADDIPSSDIVAREVLDYFENNGDALEQQEAYYYAGSVYRDLKDTPRALEYFYKSVNTATDYIDCDSLLLRNAYSWISYLLTTVQDYHRANEFAKKEYEIAKSINNVTIHSLMHLGVSYQCIDSLEKAKDWLDKAYNKLLESNPVTDAETVYNLIYNYSQILDYKQARACYELSKRLPENDVYKPKYLNLGIYFYMINQQDSAIMYFKRVVDDNYDLFNVYDASKNLLHIYYDLGNYKEAAYYANIFRNACESLDLGKRQELAATVNNQFQYHFDKEKEQKLKDEKFRLHYMVIIISVAAVLGMSLLILLLIYKKNRNLKNMLRLSKELDGLKTSQEELKEKVCEKEKALITTQELYIHAREELDYVNEKLLDVSNEVDEQKRELKVREKELADRLDQNRIYMKLIHQSDLEGKARDVVDAIKQTTDGKRRMTSTEWKQLYQAVDELYPYFHDQLTENVEKLTEQKTQVCYLMKIGMTNLQIQNITGLSRVTVWRWVKRYNWVLTNDMQ